MKKKFLATLVFTFVLVLGLGSIAVSAASYKTSIKKLINHLNNLEWEAIMRMDQEYDEVTYSSSEIWMAETAAISMSFTDKDIVDYVDEGYMETYYYGINQKTYEKECLDIFGKKVSLANLRFGGDDRYMMQAYETNDYGFIVKNEIFDTETGMKVIDLSIKKSGKKYIATEKIFWGYWGEAENATEPNYQLTYTFKKSSKSSYGYVLTKLTVKRL